MRYDQLESQLNCLLNVLSEQLDIYNQLLKTVRKEKNAVAVSAFDILNDVITEKTYLVHKLNEIEKQRIFLMDAIAANYDIDVKHFTLSLLADRVDQKTAEELLQLRRDLSSVLRKLQFENNINKDLITHCISLMNNSINLLNSMNDQAVTYIQNGRFTKTKENGVLFTSKI
ncbi:MAG: flagellar protein FlgN [Desulfobacteraceae bacterium]|jgi:flagellar biosynthesis/type III secretory pathway chaperone